MNSISNKELVFYSIKKYEEEAKQYTFHPTLTHTSYSKVKPYEKLETNLTKILEEDRWMNFFRLLPIPDRWSKQCLEQRSFHLLEKAIQLNDNESKSGKISVDFFGKSVKVAADLFGKEEFEPDIGGERFSFPSPLVEKEELKQEYIKKVIEKDLTIKFLQRLSNFCGEGVLKPYRDRVTQQAAESFEKLSAVANNLFQFDDFLQEECDEDGVPYEEIPEENSSPVGNSTSRKESSAPSDTADLNEQEESMPPGLNIQTFLENHIISKETADADPLLFEALGNILNDIPLDGISFHTQNNTYTIDFGGKDITVARRIEEDTVTQKYILGKQFSFSYLPAEHTIKVESDVQVVADTWIGSSFTIGRLKQIKQEENTITVTSSFETKKWGVRPAMARKPEITFEDLPGKTTVFHKKQLISKFTPMELFKG